MIKFNSKWNMDLNLKSKITLHQEESILKNDLSDIKIWKCFWSMPWKWKWSRLVAQLCLTLCDHGPFTPWTVAYQAPPSMGFSRQAYWSGLPLPSSGDLPNPGIKPRSPILQADALPSEPPGKPQCILLYIWLIKELMDKILFCKIKNYFLRVKRIKDKLWNEINYFQCMCLVRE